MVAIRIHTADVDEAVEPWLQGCMVDPHGRHRCDGQAMVVKIMVGSSWPTLMRRSSQGCDTDPHGRR
jgi:hypothetical protein